MIWKWCYYGQGPPNTEQQVFAVQLFGQFFEQSEHQKNWEIRTGRTDQTPTVRTLVNPDSGFGPYVMDQKLWMFISFILLYYICMILY